MVINKHVMIDYLNKYIIVALLFISSMLSAQNDTIQLKNNDVLVGKIKSLSNGVLTFEAAYSDSDFKIVFEEVKDFVVQRKCVIILTNGRRYFGNLRTIKNGPKNVSISLEDRRLLHFKQEEVIALQEIEDEFWKKFNGTIDLGYNFTKANSNSQVTIAGQLEFNSEKWLVEGDFSVLNSTQDDADKIRRTDAKLEVIRLFSKTWYVLSDLSFLKNTEQAIDSRLSPSIGVGKLLVSTDKLYLGITLGVAYNIENFVDASLDKTSSEAVFLANFKMFDFGNFDLKTGVKFYSGLSESGRFRTDYDLTCKYDLPLDLYIKTGFTLNYDNQPAVIGSDYDYVFTSGFGWEF